MNPHGDQLIGLRMSVSQLLELPDELRRDAMNPERDQLIEIHMLVPAFFQLLHPLRRRSMNPHGDEFVRVRLIARLAQCVNHFRCHAVNAESDELVRVQSLQILGLYLSGELQADIVDGHRKLLVAVYFFKSQRLHLLRILCLRQEMKETGALPVVKKPFAFEFSGVARDREMNFLSSGLREIQTRKLARGPVRTVMEVMPAAGIHQRKLDFPLNVRAPDRPISALRVSAPRFGDSKYDSRDRQNENNGSMLFHGMSLLSFFIATFREYRRA